MASFVVMALIIFTAASVSMPADIGVTTKKALDKLKKKVAVKKSSKSGKRKKNKNTLLKKPSKGMIKTSKLSKKWNSKKKKQKS